ncbi:MAG: hypothetical protein A4S17_09610 [Proteobacteria bacterium HN_bin10]|nr:MAG: hypothetical protein A4S17_09610 [Proteobacteria bacterium HN_bin10]
MKRSWSFRGGKAKVAENSASMSLFWPKRRSCSLRVSASRSARTGMSSNRASPHAISVRQL